MKAEILLSVRRSAGLATTCTTTMVPRASTAVWRKIPKQKQQWSPGKPSTCQYGEFLNIAENFVAKYRRNVHWAVRGDGPYQLAPKLSYLEVTEKVWRGHSAKEKVARIASVHQARTSAYEVGDTQVVMRLVTPKKRQSQVNSNLRN